MTIPTKIRCSFVIYVIEGRLYKSLGISPEWSALTSPYRLCLLNPFIYIIDITYIVWDWTIYPVEGGIVSSVQFAARVAQKTFLARIFEIQEKL